MNFRKHIFDLVEPPDITSHKADLYDIFMFFCIIISIIPLAFKNAHPAFTWIDKITCVIFIVDYILRWVTSDYKFKCKNKIFSFLKYPFSFLAIIDLLSILPSISTINSGFKLLKIFRMFRIFRVFKIFKTLRYSKSIYLIINAFKRQKDALLIVCWIAIAYIIISALIILNVEPQSFGSFFDAIYWAAVSLTTVGYGDIYPVTMGGRIITIISSFFGIAIVAMPAGIITAGIMDVLNDKDKKA